MWKLCTCNKKKSVTITFFAWVIDTYSTYTHKTTKLHANCIISLCVCMSHCSVHDIYLKKFCTCLETKMKRKIGKIRLKSGVCMEKREFSLSPFCSSQYRERNGGYECRKWYKTFNEHFWF